VRFLIAASLVDGINLIARIYSGALILNLETSLWSSILYHKSVISDYAFVVVVLFFLLANVLTLCCSESAELAEVEAHLLAEDKRDDDATAKSQKVTVGVLYCDHVLLIMVDDYQREGLLWMRHGLV
jgi:hypothetical protein